MIVHKGFLFQRLLFLIVDTVSIIGAIAYICQVITLLHPPSISLAQLYSCLGCLFLSQKSIIHYPLEGGGGKCPRLSGSCWVCIVYIATQSINVTLKWMCSICVWMSIKWQKLCGILVQSISYMWDLRQHFKLQKKKKKGNTILTKWCLYPLLLECCCLFTVQPLAHAKEWHW